MSIAKNLVQLMQGNISVKSELGKGSTFIIRLPQRIADKTPIGKETSENISNFKFSSQKKLVQTEWENLAFGKILIVDDLNANIYVTRGLLAPYGLQIDSAKSGFEAIEKIEKGATYDLILMDHMMPQMDGIETVRRIRKMGYKPPIVAFTANAIVGQEDDFMEKGFDGFVSKPIQSMHLDAVLTRFVSSKPQIDVDAPPKLDINELYKDFVKTQKNIVPELQNAVKSKEYKEARLMVHTLKSLAGLINETELTNLASEAESALRDGRQASKLLKSLYAETERVLLDVGLKIKYPSANNPTPSEEKTTELFERLETMLLQNDAEVITTIPALSALANTEELIASIEIYNFTQALEELKKLKK
jgi:CheY-like chemotaxis protein